MELLEFKNVDFCYAGTEKKALKNINCRFNKWEIALIMGRSGSGKTTLLRHMKKCMMPAGDLSGEILFANKPLCNIDLRISTQAIGFVQQNPDNQIVTDKVWHELAFGLENLGVSNQEIRKRIAEMVEYFGISSWYRKDIADLSGGQKQLLNLAATMIMKPQILILDEPTAQLDPVAADRFLETVFRLNQELGTTIIMTEHRTEKIFGKVDRVIAMDHGEIICDTSPQKAVEYFLFNSPQLEVGLSAPIKIYGRVVSLSNCENESGKLKKNFKNVGEEVGIEDKYKTNHNVKSQYNITNTNENQCPLNVIQGQTWLRKTVGDLLRKQADKNHEKQILKIINQMIIDNRSDKISCNQEIKHQIVIEVKDVTYRYSRQTPLVLEHLNLSVTKGTFLGILGGNGAGKSTLLKLLCGIRKPVMGKVKCNKRVSMLPQNPLSLFTEVSVEEELAEAVISKSNTAVIGMSREQKIELVNQMLISMDLDEIRKQNPNDISGGQQQKLALAKVMLYQPDILLLDEPTKGLDPYFKEFLGEQLSKLNKEGMTILMVSHDIEFCSRFTKECAFLFDGQLVTKDQTGKFFAGNTFYTTDANRMASDIFPDCVTCEEVVKAVEILSERQDKL